MGEAMRVAGQAFGDGVLMRTAHYWVLAKQDGTLEHGFYRPWSEKHPRLNFFLVRSLASLFDAVSLIFRIDRRSRSLSVRPLVLWMGGYTAVLIPVAFLIDRWLAENLVVSIAFMVSSFAAALWVITKAFPGAVWSYHGAEHKVVNAYEGGADLGVLEEVKVYSRIHPRCGTNLVSLIFAFSLVYIPIEDRFSFWAGTAYSVLSLGLSMELFRRITRVPGSRISKTLLTGGEMIQRYLTTREPTEAQLEVAARALTAAVALENRRLCGS
ncbi:MAG: DUF1385 domain-containing protein [Candidatus Aquicultorales bacterium]